MSLFFKYISSPFHDIGQIISSNRDKTLAKFMNFLRALQGVQPLFFGFKYQDLKKGKFIRKTGEIVHRILLTNYCFPPVSATAGFLPMHAALHSTSPTVCSVVGVGNEHFLGASE